MVRVARLHFCLLFPWERGGFKESVVRNNLVICLAVIYLVFFGISGVRDAYLRADIGGMIFPASSFFVAVALFSMLKRVRVHE